MEATGSIHRRLPQVFLLPFCLALVIVNIALQRQNSKLAASLEDVRYARGPQQGGTLQQLSGLDALGRPVTFNLAMQKNRTLLLVLSARCGACTENWPKWRDSPGARGLRARPFQFDRMGRERLSGVFRVGHVSSVSVDRSSSGTGSVEHRIASGTQPRRCRPRPRTLPGPRA